MSLRAVLRADGRGWRRGELILKRQARGLMAQLCTMGAKGAPPSDVEGQVSFFNNVEE